MLIAVLLAVGAGYFVVAVVVPDKVPTYGPSMGTTLGKGPSDVDVDFRAFERRSPVIGDIVIAQAPRGAARERCGVQRGRDEPCAYPNTGYGNLRVVKRIVAAPGDTIRFTADGLAVVDGQPLDEPYLRPCRPRVCALPDGITVPADHWFLAGDNRRMSSDSRAWGPVPTEALDGLVEPPAGG